MKKILISQCRECKSVRVKMNKGVDQYQACISILKSLPSARCPSCIKKSKELSDRYVKFMEKYNNKNCPRC